MAAMVGWVMEKVVQYAQFAEECRKLAAILVEPDDKKALEIMAYAWETVAKERQQQLSTRAENGTNC
ncbi:MAG: hypothetical protein WAK63_12130 [Xanthobacteraceae bacterium]